MTLHLGAKSGCETAQGWLPAEHIRCDTPRRGNAASNADTPAWARRSSNTASRRSEGAQRNRLCNLRSENSGCAPKLRTAEERSGNDAEKQGPTQYRCLASHHMATCFCALALTRRLKRRTTTHFHMATATSTEEASLDVPVKPSARGRRCKLGLPRAKAAKLSRESPDTSRVKTPRRDAKGTYKYRPRRSGRPPRESIQLVRKLPLHMASAWAIVDTRTRARPHFSTDANGVGMQVATACPQGGTRC